MEEKIIPDGFLGLSVEDQKKYGTRNYQFGYSATVRLERAACSERSVFTRDTEFSA